MGVKESDASSPSCRPRDPSLLATAHSCALRFHLAGPRKLLALHKFGRRMFACKHAVQTQLPQDKIFLVSRSENTSFPDLVSEAKPAGPAQSCTTIPVGVSPGTSVGPLPPPPHFPIPPASCLLLQPLQHTVPRQTRTSVLSSAPLFRFCLSRGSWRFWLQAPSGSQTLMPP